MSAGWRGLTVYDLDNNGYLKKLNEGDEPKTLVSDDLWGRDESDDNYVLLYDGEGELKFWLANPTLISQEPGRIEFKLPSGRWGLRQTSTNPTNYLRNIRIVPLSAENNFMSEITRKNYKETWADVGVMRFLDAQKINNSEEIKWSERQKQSTFGAPKGQAIEDIIKMANEMNINPWVMVPHLADDDYFRQMAIYVREHLNPHLKVYIEYTNEAWNFGFKQAQYLYDLSRTNKTGREREYGLRAKKLFEIWEEVFNGNERIVRVIGTQFYNPWITEQIMKTPGLAGAFDAIAVGYYIGHEFSGEKAEDFKTMTNDQVFDYLRDVSFPEAKEMLKAQKLIASNQNVELIAYEAGQHLLAGGSGKEDSFVVDKFIQLNKSPRMYQFYLDMHQQWKDIGGGLIVWFKTAYKANKWGSWGLLENVSSIDLESPKFRAYKKILNESSCHY